MNPEKIRYDFPIFKNVPNLVYLDNAATSQKPNVVIDEVNKFYSEQNSNVHRGLYSESEAATELYESARQKVADFINAKSSSEIIFTSGTTEGINFIAHTWGLEKLKQGDEILITQAEHHANLLPWQQIAKKTGATLNFIKINPQTYSFNDPEKALSPKTKLLCITHNSNVLGPIWGNENAQINALTACAKKFDIKVLVDSAQVAAHQKIDVQALNADFVVFSGHKMFAPTGVGILYIKNDLHDEISPFQFGGGMVASVDWYSAKLAPAPHKFEAGTPPISAAIGLGVAIDYMQSNLDFDWLKKHEATLCTQLLEGLQKFKGVKIIGNTTLINTEGHLVSFAVEGIHAHDIAGFLGTRNIAVRAGHHCAHPLVKSLGLESLVRVSFAAYNNSDEVDSFIKELDKAISFFT